MDVPLVVILGAGASRGAGPFSANDLQGAPNQMVPPLTVELFNERQYRSVLNEYVLAHQAGRLITELRANNGALALEAAIHDLSESRYVHHRRMAIALPLYFQHLLHEVSDGRTTETLHYDRLIERLLCLPYVFFVSLNYDVLLDRRLHPYRSLSQISGYIGAGQNWSLIKPHGSVNWYYETDAHFLPVSPPLDIRLSGDIRGVAPDASLNRIRDVDFSASVLAATRHYPALAAPEGADDKLVLPPDHEKFLVELNGAREMDILVIGYSGLDKEILSLLTRVKRKVRRMTVVDRNYDAASGVYERLCAADLKPVWPNVIDGDFASWSDDGGLSHLVDEYGGPYHLNDPAPSGS